MITKITEEELGKSILTGVVPGFYNGLAVSILATTLYDNISVIDLICPKILQIKKDKLDPATLKMIATRQKSKN